MWVVDVLSKILEMLYILELFKVAKVDILSGTCYLIKYKLPNYLFKVSCYEFLTKNGPVYFGCGVEL